MSLDDGDKAECKEIARIIVEEVLKIHTQVCPHGRTMFRMFWISVGIAVGSGIASGSVIMAIIRVFGI